MLPSQVEDYAKSTIAAILSISNIYFWKKTGYFDSPALLQPLLHTWSLAVEEQFYAFFPLGLLVVNRLSKRAKATALALLTAFSFAYSVWSSHRDPSGAFYFFLSRAWELLVGVLLTSGCLPKLKTETARNVCAALGLAMSVSAIGYITAQTRFPEWLRCYPV